MISFFDLSDVSMDNDNSKEIKKTKGESYKFNGKKPTKDDKDNICSMDGKSFKVISIQ